MKNNSAPTQAPATPEPSKCPECGHAMVRVSEAGPIPSRCMYCRLAEALVVDATCATCGGDSPKTCPDCGRGPAVVTVPRPVHAISYAAQPEVTRWCDATGGIAWPQPTTPVYATDDGWLYSFDHDKVTCDACFAKMGGDS